MFGKPKDDNDKPAAAVQQPQPQAAIKSQAATKPVAQVSSDQISTISRSMTVVGKIVDEGTVHVLGRLEGELRALTVLIGEGAKVDGDLVADELTIGGMVKGTIHAKRVRLNSTAVVEGDIFHQSLSIEENARFEGSSKREDNAGDALRTLLQHSAAHDDVETQLTAVQGIWKSNGAPSHDGSLCAEAS
jgi:cytoskeletal protein CcmA (bactofilin family)